jgi:cyclophilin family peptidyl-prolyl cis-trans isomerase
MKALLIAIVMLGLVACSPAQASTTPTTQPAAENLQITVEVSPTDEPVETEEAGETEEVEGDATEEAAQTEEVNADATEEAAVIAVSASTPSEMCEAALPAEEPATREYTAPEQVLEEGTDYRAVFCTDAGAVYVDLYEDYTPETVNNFVFLAQNNFYNNTIFHRVMQDFMAQGGDPEGTGRGGPGYQFRDEFVGFLHFDRPGLLAMANANSPEQGIVGTNGSQFFITTVPTTHLDFRHTIFGEVLEGQENVENIQIRDPNQADSPATQLQTVLIVTDPETVEAAVEAATPADADEVMSAFGGFAGVVPEDLEMVNAPESFTIETAVENAPEDLREGYSAFLEEHNYQFGYSSLIDNPNCNLDTYAFMTLGYRLDAFGSAGEASAALADSFLEELALTEEYQKTEATVLGSPLYTRTLQACNTGAQAGRVYVQRGRFIATVEATIPTDRGYGLEQVLEQFAGRLYEFTLSDILRREIRAS